MMKTKNLKMKPFPDYKTFGGWIRKNCEDCDFHMSCFLQQYLMLAANNDIEINETIMVGVGYVEENNEYKLKNTCDTKNSIN